MSFDEKGVSVVIGIILMVLITVILAAIIAAFVYSTLGYNETQKMNLTQFKPTETPYQENASEYMKSHVITLPCEYCIINQTVSTCYNCSFNKT